MSFEELGFHAQEIYEMAVEKYLRDEHMIDERDGLYYAPVRGTSHDVDEVTPRLTLDGADPLPPDGR